MNIETLLFYLFKDEAFKNAESLKTKIGSIADRIDFKDLYAKIVNYQIKKYGEQLYKYEQSSIDYECCNFMKLKRL